MRFVTCLGPDGVEEPAVLSADGTAVTPLRWLGLPCDTLTEAIPQLTPAVRAGLALALSAIPSVPLDAVQLQSPIPCPAQDVVCLGINYMAHSDEAEKYSADAFATQHQDAIYFSKRVTRAVPDGGFIEAHTDLVKKLDYECELAVVLGRDAKDVPAGQTRDYVFGYTILNDVSARDVQTAHKQWYFGKSLDGFTPIGPCIVTADEFEAYPPQLGIRSFVNGEKRQDYKAFLFGVGSLGGALLRDSGLSHFGLEIVAAFDVNPSLVGTTLNGIPIFHSDDFQKKMQEYGVHIGVLTVPIEIAQCITDTMVAGGIKAVWNFTPFRIRVPEDIVVQNTSLYAHLAVMFNRLNFNEIE